MVTPRVSGMTLVELMVTVAIVGVLATLAFPSYQAYRLKAGRGIGASCLLEAQQRLEAHFAKTMAGPPEVTLADVGLDEICGDDPDYRLSLEASSTCTGSESPGHYALRATPLGEQARDGVLVLCVSPAIANPNQRAQRVHLRPDDLDTLIAGWDFQPGH